MHNISGYIEGYYGRLLTWDERLKIVECLRSLGMTHYFYAPKEDVSHRLYWRQPYGDRWRRHYRLFCQQATQQGVKIIAGVAPGLDFNFAQLSEHDGSGKNAGSNSDDDFSLLVRKAQQLLEDGATCIALLMDDIDEDFHTRCGPYASEGHAHARLANQLADAIGGTLWVVPRAYADDIAAASPAYMPAFISELNTAHTVVHCGAGIIAKRVNQDILSQSVGAAHNVVVWDNLYANDYCPRRLFLGPFAGREAALALLLNPTGMVETDCLLLAIMRATIESENPTQAWHDVIAASDIPSQFLSLAPYFALPAFDGKSTAADLPATDEQFAALEILLWKWKTPLAREWYPWLMALKQDLSIAAGVVSESRIYKTQTAPLASVLTKVD